MLRHSLLSPLSLRDTVHPSNMPQALFTALSSRSLFHIAEVTLYPLLTLLHLSTAPLSLPLMYHYVSTVCTHAIAICDCNECHFATLCRVVSCVFPSFFHFISISLSVTHMFSLFTHLSHPFAHLFFALSLCRYPYLLILQRFSFFFCFSIHL